MSDTPRTDAENTYVIHGITHVSVHFARQLERELNAACEERDRYKADSEALDHVSESVITGRYSIQLLYDSVEERDKTAAHLRKRLEKN
mgnify:CR=1 FL=1